jgi:hypothetical protein
MMTNNNILTVAGMRQNLFLGIQEEKEAESEPGISVIIELPKARYFV